MKVVTEVKLSIILNPQVNVAEFVLPRRGVLLGSLISIRFTMKSRLALMGFHRVLVLIPREILSPLLILVVERGAPERQTMKELVLAIRHPNKRLPPVKMLVAVKVLQQLRRPIPEVQVVLTAAKARVLALQPIQIKVARMEKLQVSAETLAAPVPALPATSKAPHPRFQMAVRLANPLLPEVVLEALAARTLVLTNKNPQPLAPPQTAHLADLPVLELIVAVQHKVVQVKQVLLNLALD